MDRGKKVERSTLIIVSTFMLVLGFAGGSRIDDIKNLIAPVFGMKRVEKLDLSAVENKLELVVTDYCGNETKEEYEF